MSADNSAKNFPKSVAPKGANSLRKGGGKSQKKVLGRGLNALMAASAVKVDFGGGASEDEKGRRRSLAPGASVPRPEALQKSISREQALARPFAAEESAEVPPEGGMVYLNLDRIEANPNQPRKVFKDKELDELSSSIKASGVLQPILVRRRQGATGPLAKYEIIAGERRFRAATRAGISRVPALVRQLDDRETLELSIVENVQRSNLNPIEEAEAYSRLIEEFGVSQEQVAKVVGRSRSAVANALRLLKLDPRIRSYVADGVLSAGHARAVLMLEKRQEQDLLALEIKRNQLSVRDAERRATEIMGRAIEPPSASQGSLSSSSSVQPDPNIDAIEQRLRRSLGTKVKLLQKKNGSGELRISFFSSDELEKLLESLDS